MMSYEHSCRLCLIDLNEAAVDCSSIPELYETVQVLFDVQICRTDNIRAICNRCLDYVMGYRALKKKITECQKIIEDYEDVRKKVMETRNIARAIAIKQEIIDVDAFECSTPNTHSTANNYLCPRPKAVTDSDINDILALVHDKSSNKRPSSAISPQKRVSKLKSIKSELSLDNESRSDSLEPISSTSKDVLEKSTENVPPEVPSRNRGAMKNQRQEAASPMDAPADAVSSSVQTPSEADKKIQPERVSTRKRRLTAVKSQVNRSRAQNKSRNAISSNTTRASAKCTMCSLKLRSNTSLKSHMLEKHSINSETSPIGRNIKEEDSISSTGSKETSIRRSARQAGKAMKQLSPNTESLANGRRSRVKKIAETPDNSLAEPQYTSTPMAVASEEVDDKSAVLKNQNQTVKSEGSSTNMSGSSSTKDNSLNKSDKKRIITITLVRTKDSLNFRYCDQHKRNIEFHTVSPDELEDIRKSLMIPEIWANLREAFKNSPPDGRTIEQLKTILGDEFVL